MNTEFNWTHLQTFLAVAKHRSLTGAAHALRGSQPTMGRHISALENDLGIRLFERSGGGLELTSTGLELLDYAREMSETAARLSLRAEGQSESIAGIVRITASEVGSAFVLPPILTKLHEQEPQIEIEFVASDRTENLLLREADIAVRMYRPTQVDVITKKVGDVELGMFAAHSYLENRGIPTSKDDLWGHDFIGYDRNQHMIDGFRAAGIEVDRHFFAFRCDDQVMCWNMVVAGFGIGFNQVGIGEREPKVARLEPELEIPPLPIWLTAHSELKTSKRVRRVYDFLAEELKKSVGRSV
jgi:DNA-binding transcriptional LysR family regulator